jgi:hypothetical protein
MGNAALDIYCQPFVLCGVFSNGIEIRVCRGQMYLICTNAALLDTR